MFYICSYRFKAKYNVTVEQNPFIPVLAPQEMLYVFNPCVPFTIAQDEGEEALGSRGLCKDVTVSRAVKLLSG